MKKHNEQECPSRKVLKILSGKWSMLIMYYLGETQRYGELKKLIPDISEKMLIQNLKQLAELKVVKRKDFHQIPPKVEYSLTPLGEEFLSLIPILVALGKKLLLTKAI